MYNLILYFINNVFSHKTNTVIHKNIRHNHFKFVFLYLFYGPIGFLVLKWEYKNI